MIFGSWEDMVGTRFRGGDHDKRKRTEKRRRERVSMAAPGMIWLGKKIKMVEVEWFVE